MNLNNNASAVTVTKTIRVGVTGHRKLGADLRVHCRVQQQRTFLLDRLRGMAKDCGKDIFAYSAFAIGADQLFAEAALGLQVPLVGLAPFEEYPEDFEGDDRTRFEKFLNYCVRVEKRPPKKRSNKAHFNTGKWMVKQCDSVVAVWDGQRAKGVGGTGDVVKFGTEKSKEVMVIDPEKKNKPQ